VCAWRVAAASRQGAQRCAAARRCGSGRQRARGSGTARANNFRSHARKTRSARTRLQDNARLAGERVAPDAALKLRGLAAEHRACAARRRGRRREQRQRRRQRTCENTKNERTRGAKGKAGSAAQRSARSVAPRRRLHSAHYTRRAARAAAARAQRARRCVHACVAAIVCAAPPARAHTRARTCAARARTDDELHAPAVTVVRRHGCSGCVGVGRRTGLRKGGGGVFFGLSFRRRARTRIMRTCSEKTRALRCAALRALRCACVHAYAFCVVVTPSPPRQCLARIFP
jgi:hypothetical protein